MQYGLLELVGARRSVELAHEEFERIKAARDGLLEAVYLEEKFDFLIENYLEFESELLAVAARHLVFGDREPGWMHKERNVIGRRIINFLTTCRTYVDHAPQHLGTMYGSGSDQQSEFRQARHRVHTSLFGYRVMEEMRNYVQHQGHPIQLLSFPLRPAANKEQPGVLFTATPIIRVSTVGDDPKFKPSVLEEMKRHGEKLDAKPLIREYMEGLSRVHARVRELVQEDVVRWETVVTEALAAFGPEPPKHAHLVTVQDDATFSYQAPVWMDPIERRKSFERKKRAPHELAGSFVSGAAE